MCCLCWYTKGINVQDVRRFFKNKYKCLQEHRTIRTGEEPYPCPDCSKRFARAKNAPKISDYLVNISRMIQPISINFFFLKSLWSGCSHKYPIALYLSFFIWFSYRIHEIKNSYIKVIEQTNVIVDQLVLDQIVSQIWYKLFFSVCRSNHHL